MYSCSQDYKTSIISIGDEDLMWRIDILCTLVKIENPAQSSFTRKGIIYDSFYINRFSHN